MKSSDLEVGDILRYCNTFHRVQSFDDFRATFFSFATDGGNGRVVAFLIAMLQEPDEILRPYKVNDAKVNPASGAGFGLFATRNDARAANEAAKPAPLFKVGDVVRCGDGPKMTVEGPIPMVGDRIGLDCIWWTGSSAAGNLELHRSRFPGDAVKAVLPG